MGLRYQTLNQFMKNPFGLKPQEIPYAWRNNSLHLIETGKIRLMQILEYEGSYFYNIEVPSESNPNLHYDVVIQFIPPTSDLTKKGHIRDYYVKFFSNSPGFVYKYAALYYAEGFLIDSLMSKLGEDFIQAPTKTNPKMELAMDKSIYYAASLIIRNDFYFSFKDSFTAKRTKNVQKFLEGVLEFDGVMANIEVEKFKKSAKQQLAKDKSGANRQTEANRKQKRDTLTGPGKINVIGPKGKITSKNTTFATQRAMTKVASRKGRIMANAKVRSTFKKR